MQADSGIGLACFFCLFNLNQFVGDDSVFHIEGNHIVIDISDISYYPVAKGIRLEREVYRKL